ncbi:phosphatidylethanolamine N-methyltransferase /phosphatidyl-N-methylethanolamine N-methyltransferase [Nocardiopsis sp. Huas11]|uniref:class I SAM-dependent methyltransferase n=1 Tax=Nocardiopsis sp. Huas11 TaxID=2183912 RepID=UPI000EAF7AF0|nr:class I SAM-dependent methyltransferase [Nocardiopsis sp. Huas11]RKS05726.1 phosphatidylethanolamine N-methyltransferase /phosphatidyl-N-methylethanolamine N-methyltransferase [Nocardiopsis sp. Huas11]
MDERTTTTRRQWDRMAAGYARGAGLDRRLLGRTRAVLCGGARGRVLEVAVGTGNDLPYYPPGTDLTVVDLSPGMLARARTRAQAAGIDAVLVEGDAQDLPFADGEFDSVVCALALCTIPDQRAGLAEMWRVLRPGGRLALVDHVEYTRWPLRGREQRKARPRRRPLDVAVEVGFEIDRHDRLALGLLDLVIAHRPA